MDSGLSEVHSLAYATVGGAALFVQLVDEAGQRFFHVCLFYEYLASVCDVQSALQGVALCAIDAVDACLALWLLCCAPDACADGEAHGYIVQLGDLGSFAVKLSSEGVPTAAEFNANAHIKKVTVRWTPGEDFKTLIQDAEYQYVTTKEEQAAARKAAKQAIDAESGNTSGSGSGSDKENGE